MLIVNNRIRIPLDEFSFTFTRSGGPGGQNVNKVNTKATLRWPVADSPSLPETVRQRFLEKNRRRITNEGELVMSSQRYRDQARNVDDCLEKLRDLLAEAAIVPKVRKKTRPTRGSKERRLKAKQQKSDKKQGRKPPRFD
ncbi:MAG: alternative ribosome rescue aminoacyl-tRNA hydrolase ArfB [Pirellulaceae bacterium]